MTDSKLTPAIPPAGRLPKSTSQSSTLCQQFRGAISTVPVLLLNLDGDGVVTQIEGRGLAADHIRAEEWVGHPFLDICKDCPQALQAIRRALAGESVAEIVNMGDLVFEAHFSPTRAGERVTGVAGVAINITERHRAQHELAESRRMLLTLMSNLPGMVYRCINDRDWTMAFVSDGCLDLTGYPPEDLIDNRRIAYNQIVHPDDRERIWKEVQDGVTTRRPFQLIYRIVRADGQTRWVWEQGRGLFSPTGSLEVLEGYITDITESKQAEEKVRLLSLAVEQTSEGVGVVDLEGRHLFVNRAIESIHGYKPEDVLGRHLSMFHSPEQMPAVEQALRQVRDTGHFEGEIGHRHRDGHHVPVHMHISLLKDERDVPVAIIGTFRDITPQKQAEEALRKERNFNRALVQASPAFFVAISPGGKTLMMNQAMLTALGYSFEEVVGKDYLTNFVPAEDREKLAVIFERLASTSESTQNENQVLTRDGRHLLVEWHGRQVLKKNGQPDFFFGVGIDVTERKKAAEERARLEAQLHQIQKLEAIGQLAGGVAHDFNNLLAVIMGNASIVKRYPELPPKISDALTDILTAAERGSTLTQQLLTYARGGIQQPTATDLNRLIQSVVPMLQRTAPPGVRFELHLADDLAPVLADPPRIEQIVMNLLLNAVQASTAPGIITVTTRDDVLDAAAAAALQVGEGRYLRLEVSDQGAGIPSEVQAHIFEPFFTTKKMGRGMGLAVTLGIVQSHSGQIRIDSAPGKGATVTVWLPATDQLENALRPADGGAFIQRPPRGDETILVIDDEHAICATVEQLLSSLGYCVITHSDADRALAFLGTNAEDVNLVICDFTMPKHSGRQIAQLIAEEYPHITVLLSSGYDAETLSQELSGVKVSGLLIKPFSLLALAQAVREALDRAQADPPALT